MENSQYLRKNLNSVHRLIRVFIGTFLIIFSAIAFKNSWWIAVISAIGGTQILEGIIAY